MVSICLLTWDRFDVMERCVSATLNRAGYPYELIVCDQGSNDERVIRFIEGLAPDHFRRNGDNEGYAPAVNQMLLRACGEYVCVLDNDMLMPQGWLAALVEANQRIPRSGLSSLYCVDDLPRPINDIPAPRVVGGQIIHPHYEVFGAKFMNRIALEAAGAFCEDYGVYSHEDNDICFRLHLMGFENYYLGGMVCQHVGQDFNDRTKYRLFKHAAHEAAKEAWEANCERYRRHDGLHILPPPQLEPLREIYGWLHPENRQILELLIGYYKVEDVCEIGSFLGQSAEFFARRCKKVHCIDPWLETAEEEADNNLVRSVIDGVVPRDFYAIFERNLRRRWLWSKIEPHRGLSSEVADEVPEVDLVYIDGDHSYEGCRRDIELYAPKARLVVCGDDINDSRFPGVRQAVKEAFPVYYECGPFWWVAK